VTLDVFSDRSVAIRASVADVKLTLLGRQSRRDIIFVFLRNMSATLIPNLALPASIVATFAVMCLLDYGQKSLADGAGRRSASCG
jgi:multidrug efflux pump subunit AcrB